MSKPKVCQNSATFTTDNGEITFVAARNVKNMNGYTYDVKSLQAQNSAGDYISLSSEPQDVAIPLMEDHNPRNKAKIGVIDKAHIENVEGIDQVVMHAVFFDSDEAQEIRQRVLKNELTDVSITTDFGTNEDVWETGNLENAKIVEVSVVYAGAEPKAKILAKNSIDTEADEVEKETENDATQDEPTENPELDNHEVILGDEQLEKLAGKVADKLKDNKSDEVEAEEETEAETEEEEQEDEMAKQPTNTTDKVADKELVLNTLAKLAQSGAIRGMNRNQVIEAVKNDVDLLGEDGNAYVVPDAVFTEILAITKPTDILNTFDTIPVKRFTLMGEVPSEADLARAGRWSKGEQKQIQDSDLKAQKFSTQFLYKLQEISYEDLQEDFGDLLLAYIRTELPQKVTEEEERAFIVGDGRASNNPRHISSIVSLDAAAEDNANVHVVKYDGTNDASNLAAIMNGLAKINVEGATYVVMNKTTLGSLKAAGLSSASGLPFSDETVAGALGVERIYTREYVANNVVYGYVGRYVKRLTGGNSGESIEQYDIDYNNRKIEFIRPVGGGASGLASAVKITLAGTVSA